MEKVAMAGAATAEVMAEGAVLGLVGKVGDLEVEGVTVAEVMEVVRVAVVMEVAEVMEVVKVAEVMEVAATEVAMVAEAVVQVEDMEIWVTTERCLHQEQGAWTLRI